MTREKKAIVLLSGGLDSSTCAAIAKDRGYSLYALTFSYGQRHTIELQAAKRVADYLGVTQQVVATIDLRVFGGSALTADIDVPKDRAADEMEEGIPITYVPARNTIFLSYAMAWAEVLEAEAIFIGVNALDYSGYPDCRPEFISAFQHMANLATRAGVEGAGVRIETPIIDMTKADIVRAGMALGFDYGLTITCYDPDQDGTSCGRCDSCRLRLKGFAEAGYDDPIAYAKG